MSFPVDDGGCGWYRVRQPFEMINLYSDSEAHVMDKEKDDMVMVAKALTNTDVVVLRQGGEVGVPYFKEKFPHLKFVLDIDDNMEIISPYSQHYGEYGTEEVKHDGKWLWRDGQGGFDLKKNREKIRSLIGFMKSVDLVTVTTEKLAEYVSQYTNKVKVLPNCIDFRHWWKLPLKENKQIRVGWSGGISHYEDWYSIKKPLNDLMREFQFKLIMVGSDFSGIVDDDNKHLVEVYPWLPFKAHSYRMMCLNLDFAIIPLANLPFNHYKSSIKFYEMSAMGVPSVVSNILPYKEDIDGVSWGYNTPGEFKSCVTEALVRSSKLELFGKQAQSYINEYFNAKTNTHLWLDAYSDLLRT